MSGKNLLVVESPAKAKTIAKYLGNDYIVLSSRGHVRSIPSRSNAVHTENNFETEYEINPGSSKYLDAIISAAKGVDKIYMASDQDREGEAIAWHVLEVLKTKKIPLENKVHRITFNEVTPAAIKAALKAPRAIDMDLVAAQRARQSLDYLVGFSISPILWRKLPGSKSAGRVQSVALRVLCEREYEIMRFKSTDYWTITGSFAIDKDHHFTAELSEINTNKIEKFTFISENSANNTVNILKQLKYTVQSVEKKEVQRNPDAPFITSTLIQAASSSLKMSSKKTMQVAQKLYEGMKINDHVTGLITYMRTDSTSLSSEVVDKARELIQDLYGDEYLPKESRIFKNKIKNAQEAHEAIRPTDPFIVPAQLKEFLTDDEWQLYELIWKRFMSCQMSPVKLAKTIVKITGISSKLLDITELDADMQKLFKPKIEASFKVIGTIMLFDGFQKLINVTKELSDDIMLPIVVEGDSLITSDIFSKEHSTTAPSRYSEATLVKKMEELGIGRPSTYATIISILQERQYVLLTKNKFLVEDRGKLVNTFLNSFFSKYVEYGFTASLEEELDEIADGKKDSINFLKDFWIPFKENVDEISQMQTITILDKIQGVLEEFLFAQTPDAKKCPKCKDGQLRLKNSKYAPFIGCSKYPDCDYAQKFKLYSNHDKDSPPDDTAITFLKSEDENAKQPMININNLGIIAQDDEEQIMLNKGQYGYYVSLCKNNIVEQNVSLNTFKSLDDLKLEFILAKKLFEMPYKIGIHKSGDEIKLGIGRYGPYIIYKRKFYSIKTQDLRALLQFSVEDAINLIANKK